MTPNPYLVVLHALEEEGSDDWNMTGLKAWLKWRAARFREDNNGHVGYH